MEKKAEIENLEEKGESIFGKVTARIEDSLSNAST
jgi:hypothetical protein